MTAKMYRLPDGTEAKGGVLNEHDGIWAQVYHDTLGIIRIRADRVEPVPPPLPPEPEPGAYLIGGTPAVRWAGDDDEAHWQVESKDGTAGFVYVSWRELATDLGGSGFSIVRLVPAPEPVALPWEITNIHGYRNRGVWVARLLDRVDIRVGDDDGTYTILPTPVEARAMAAALLSAADEAERSTS